MLMVCQFMSQARQKSFLETCATIDREQAVGKASISNGMLDADIPLRLPPRLPPPAVPFHGHMSVAADEEDVAGAFS